MTSDERSFTVPPSPSRVIFGGGALDRLPELVTSFGAERVLVIASAGRLALVDRIGALLGSRLIGVENRAAMHVPAALADSVRADVALANADLVVAVGGGSAIGMAKAVALTGGPPIVAIPTTYSGSEMTAIWGITRDGVKETGRDERVRPRAVLYDPSLTIDLPARVSGPSLLNALAHALEALYAPDVNPLVRLAAIEGIRAIAGCALRVVHAPGDADARSEALYGAWLAGFALGHATMGLHHKLAHVLGGSFGMPHAETHAVLLPHTFTYNAPFAARAMADAGTALDADGEVAAALHRLTSDVLAAAGAPTTLAGLGLSDGDIERAADIAVAKPYPNPRPLDREAIAALLRRAYDGSPPIDAP